MRHFLFLLAFGLCFLGCDSADLDTEPFVCNLSIDETTLTSFGSDPFTVTYRAEGTGSFTLSSLSYLNAGGTNQTVTQPTLPWTTTMSVAPGGTVAMSALGTVTNGSLTIRVTADDQNGATFNLSDDCSQTID